MEAGATGPKPALPPARNRVRRGHAPTPHSAEEIRKACPQGHFRRYLVEVPNEPPLYRKLTFQNATKDAVEMRTVQVDAEGNTVGERRQVWIRWQGLQAEASFPKGITTISDVTLVTNAGVFPSWLYELRRREGQEVERYWFARTLAGPPVRYERHVKGKRVFRMTLLTQGRSGTGASPPAKESGPTPSGSNEHPDEPGPRPADTDPADTDPDKTDPDKTDPADTDPDDSDPVDSDPDDSDPAAIQDRRDRRRPARFDRAL